MAVHFAFPVNFFSREMTKNDKQPILRVKNCNKVVEAMV
jgi:hypothetical protein